MTLKQFGRSEATSIDTDMTRCCLYVEERVQSSNRETLMEYLSNSLFTFGESSDQHNVMQLLFTNTVDLQNENSTVEC